MPTRAGVESGFLAFAERGGGPWVDDWAVRTGLWRERVRARDAFCSSEVYAYVMQDNVRLQVRQVLLSGAAQIVVQHLWVKKRW